jgi:hypothetical protein
MDEEKAVAEVIVKAKEHNEKKEESKALKKIVADEAKEMEESVHESEKKLKH